MDAQSLITQFEAGTLPKSHFTHEAHLTMALWHVSRAPDVWSAICVIKDRIISYNRMVGGNNTADSGYHETITIFWALELFDFWSENREMPFDRLVEKLVREEKFTSPAYIKQFYDAETLKSSRARATYVPPTLSALRR